MENHPPTCAGSVFFLLIRRKSKDNNGRIGKGIGLNRRRPKPPLFAEAGRKAKLTQLLMAA
jgi:hypothetical protein